MPVYLDQHYEPGGGAYRISISDEDLGYKYPGGIDLRPGSELHAKILSALMTRAQESQRVMSSRYNSWRAVERSLTVYVNPERKESARSNREKVEPVIVPVTFAILETLLTYMVAAFIESPLFKYEGVGPEDVVGGMIMQRVVDNSCVRNKVALALHTMFRDGFVNGFAVVAPMWKTEKRLIRRVKTSGFRNMLNEAVSAIVGRRTEEITVEGNYLANIDPYLYLPDPNVPIHEVQKGEFVGWVDRTNYMSLLNEEINSPKRLFNVRYLKGVAGKSSLYDAKSSSGREDTSGISSLGVYSSITNPIDQIYMYATIIPKDWQLGDSSEPEKWLFRIAADKVIIQAEAAKFNHGLYPVVVDAPDFDGYSVCPISRIETIQGLQEIVDWLFQSHIANVKKSINDMIVYDPMIINTNDLVNPEPGKLVRTRAAAWGKTRVQDAIFQLNVADITRGNVGDVSVISDIMKYTSGAVDPLQGVIKPRGERISAEEVKGARSSALSRLERAAKVTAVQAMYDIAYMFASHTQQLMSVDTYIKVFGETERRLLADRNLTADRVKVSPQDIMVAYDVIPKDGSVPGPENVDVWIELYKMVSSRPEMAMQFDMIRIFKHIARLLGAKDIDEFVRTDNRVQVMADEMLAQQVASGNLQRIEESQGGVNG